MYFQCEGRHLGAITIYYFYIYTRYHKVLVLGFLSTPQSSEIIPQGNQFSDPYKQKAVIVSKMTKTQNGESCKSLGCRHRNLMLWF